MSATELSLLCVRQSVASQRDLDQRTTRRLRSLADRISDFIGPAKCETDFASTISYYDQRRLKLKLRPPFTTLLHSG